MVLTHELVQIYCEHSPNLQWKALTAKKSIGENTILDILFHVEKN